jgi:DNA-binding SARP family transcriptional activator
MASQRLERQAEWVAAQKEIKRNELTLKQWQQEDKDTQEARMELMRSFIQQGDTASALALLDQIKQTDPAVALNPTLDAMGTEDLQTMTSSARKDVDNVAGNSEFHPGQQPQGQPTGPAVPSGAGQPWTPRVVSIPTTNPARPGPQQ